LLKEEEYFNFIQRDRNEAAGLGGRATLTPAEARLEKEFGEIADEITSLVREQGELNRLKDPQPAQLARHAEIDQRLKVADQRFQAYLKRLAQELGGARKADELMEKIRASEGLQYTLRELGPGTVSLHTVVGEDRYSVILTTADGPQVAAETIISREELNRKIFAFRDAVKNPEVDPRPLASQLYDILIGPVARNLAEAKARVLMFSLDGALRYAPLAALYDKTRGEYLNERYQTVIYTPAGAADLKISASADWKGLGFGVSTGIKDPEIGEFAALESVPMELRAVIHDGDGKNGVIEGRIFLNSQFTEQQFMDALRPQQYPLVHIASHFVFRPGNGLKSFLLLGDGRRLTLETINNTSNLFRGVELLTLSACETGIGEENERGAEIEGFGVMAQKKGAKAVLATLWNVADGSTGRLMREFYRLRASKPGITKADALQQAQLSLLRGPSQKGKPGTRGQLQSKAADARASKPATFKPEPGKPYSHPYYWAPFILIGNWK
jgi:CHAT domain-containing protein